MSAARLVLRIIVATVAVIALGTIFVFGFTVIEPFYLSFGDPPESLAWGDLGLNTLAFASFGAIGLLLVLIVWLVYAPIQTDKRQQFR